MDQLIFTIVGVMIFTFFYVTATSNKGSDRNKYKPLPTHKTKKHKQSKQ